MQLTSTNSSIGLIYALKKIFKSILKDIDKKNLIDEGLIDSLDILTLASQIEKKTKKKIDISKHLKVKCLIKEKKLERAWKENILQFQT